MNPLIRFDHVSKRFILHRERPRSFQDLFLSRLRRRNGKGEVFWALRDINLAIKQGEMLGMIGPNGAGKSTILKLMTRILQPTSGSIEVNGRVAALLELGTGFHPDLTGRENIFLNGSLMGFSRRQMQERLDSIIDFSGMEEFIDVPVRHYSSGMYMRLGFAIAVHSEPDVLITDEVLAVGDEDFQNKCLQRMSDFRDDGVTIILVSHALPIVRKLCDRAVWLQHGGIVMDGDTGDVIDAYMAEVAAAERAGRPYDAPVAAIAPSLPAITVLADLRLLDVQILGLDGAPRSAMAAGERMRLSVSYQARKPFPAACLTVQVHDADSETLVYTVNTCDDSPPLSLAEGARTIDLDDLAWPLRSGDYVLSAALFEEPAPPGGHNPADVQRQACSFQVRSPLAGPERRWGTGEALVTGVQLCGQDGLEQKEFITGETFRLRLRCISTNGLVESPLVRVQIFDRHGVLCHATNTERAGLNIGRLPQGTPGVVAGEGKEVALTYDHLDLLEGEYRLSVGLWPEANARNPYDWHDRAYPFRVRSEHRHGGGLLALRHSWSTND